MEKLTEINECFDDMENTIKQVHGFIKDVENMRILQKTVSSGLHSPSDRIAMLKAQTKVDEFIASRK